MRIGTYNVYGFRGFPTESVDRDLGDDGGDTVDHFSQALAALDTDILGLQEGSRRSRTIQGIAERLEVNLATFPSPLRWPGHVLSRHPILESRTFSHCTPGDGTPLLSRCCGAARMQVAGWDADLWVVVLHLYPGRQEVSRRQEEAAVVNRHVGNLLRETGHVAVLGDFNCAPGETVHSQLKSLGFVNVAETILGRVQPTLASPDRKDARSLDHIYLAPRLAPRLTGVDVVRDPGFAHQGPLTPGQWLHSDHVPVVAELD